MIFYQSYIPNPVIWLATVLVVYFVIYRYWVQWVTCGVIHLNHKIITDMSLCYCCFGRLVDLHLKKIDYLLSIPMCYNSLAFRPHQLTRDRNLSFKSGYYWEYAFNRPREISDRGLERLGQVHLVEAKWWAFSGQIFIISACKVISTCLS